MGAANGRTKAEDSVPLALPVCRGCKLGFRIRQLLPRLSLLSQKVLADAREHRLKRRRVGLRIAIERSLEPLQLASQQQEGRFRRSAFEEPLQAARHRLEYLEQS